MVHASERTGDCSQAHCTLSGSVQAGLLHGALRNACRTDSLCVVIEYGNFKVHCGIGALSVNRLSRLREDSSSPVTARGWAPSARAFLKLSCARHTSPGTATCVADVAMHMIGSGLSAGAEESKLPAGTLVGFSLVSRGQRTVHVTRVSARH